MNFQMLLKKIYKIMGYIREPKGVDFTVTPSVLNEDDKKAFSDAISLYKKTGNRIDAKQVNSTDNKARRIANSNKMVTISGKKKSSKNE